MTQLILALDMPQKSQNLALCENLAKHNLNNIYLKVGLRSFIRDGIGFIGELQQLGFKIFLDLKLYDIPNTMLDSLYEMAKLNIDIITIHASSGKIAMSELAKAVKELKNPPLLFAVTALTSFDEATFSEVYRQKINECVLNLSQMASECGISGIVCSPFESAKVKESFNLLTLTPAIRPILSDFGGEFDLELDSTKDDQKRNSSLTFALKQKSDFLVIGRPIYTHKEPILLTKHILKKISEES